MLWCELDDIWEGRFRDRMDASLGIDPGGGCPAYEPAHASVYLRMVRDLGEQERRGQGA